MKKNTFALTIKKYALNLIPFIISIGCAITFSMTETKFAPDGTLIEPFYLIPFTFLFFTIGIIGFIVRLVLSKIKSKKVSA